MNAVRLLLGKDLKILGRSPALLVALVLYPLLIAFLVALVARFAADKPRVGFVDRDDLPAELTVGGQTFDVSEVIDQVETEVDLIPLSEEDAEERLRSGDIVAAIVVPPGFVSRLQSLVRQPRLVLRITRGGLAGRVERQTEALVYNLNRNLQDAYIDANLEYVQLLREGGRGEFLGNEFDIVGLAGAERILASLGSGRDDPAEQRDIAALQAFVDEAGIALAQSEETLRATANPIVLELDDAGRRQWFLSAQVQAYALALTLALLSILVAAAGIASERDENVLGLAIELSGSTSFASWLRLPVIVVALALAAAAFGAFGVLLGVLARETRTAALVALLVALPLVLLGSLPEVTVSPAAWVSRAFPFVHSVNLFESILYDVHPSATIARELAWLLGLAAAFALAARLGMRRLLV